MDLRKIFREISKQIYSDFTISAQINQDGNKGDFRENSLREFLNNGRLPKRYGVGNGEIIGPTNSVSKQSDLIIYDQLNSIPLLYDNSIQIYPIDCVYGIIEVKSHLSKTKLIEGVENIKSVKKLVPDDVVMKKFLFMQQTYRRPKPFGFIFAFSLSQNSLDSLTDNLREWEENNPPELWPNLIVVLGEGLIYHSEGLYKRISSESITQNCKPTSLSFKHDSFFHFYSYLLDLCNNTELPIVEISKYLDLPQQIGKYSVGNNDRMVRFEKDGKVDRSKVYRLNEKFIDKIVTWCKENGKITNEQMFLLEFGQIPQGANEEYLKQQIYFYNPDNLPGMHEVQDPIKVNQDGKVETKERMAMPSGFITVDGDTYYYPMAYVTDEDYEIIKGRTMDDL